MANPYLILWCDPTVNKIYTGWQQNTQAPIPILKQGDNIGVEIHWVQASTGQTSMQEIEFPPAVSSVLAVGRIDAVPTAGNWSITYGTETTEILSASALASDVDTALNALTSITAEGGVTVLKTGNAFRINWNEVGAYTELLSLNINNLSPTSDSLVVEVKAGTADTNRALMASLRQSPIGAISTFTVTPSPSITVTNIFTTTWRVSIDPLPRTGTFTISELVGVTTKTSIPLSITSTSAQVASALNDLNAGHTVTKTGAYSWDISTPSTVVNLTATSAVVGFSSLYGTLNLNTAECEEFLSGATSGEAYIEIELEIAGEKQTLIQTQALVINDLISNSTFNLVDLPDVMPVDSVVRYDTAQALTEPQKLQARINIGAVDNSSIASLEAFDITIDGRVDLLELSALSTDEHDALSGAVLPSATNVFVTQSELVAGLDTKAELVHTHIATDITDSTIYGRNLLTSPSVASQRSSLELGTMALESTATYLTSSTAASTYLSISSAGANYVTFTYGANNYSQKFNQTLDTTSTVVFNSLTTTSNCSVNGSLNVASGGCIIETGFYGSPAIALAPTWAINLQGGGLDTQLTWEGLAISGTVGLSFYDPLAKINFHDGTTQDTRVVREQQANLSGYSTAGFDTTHYPHEVKVIDSTGTAYWVPARLA